MEVILIAKHNNYKQVHQLIKNKKNLHKSNSLY